MFSERIYILYQRKTGVLYVVHDASIPLVA